MGLRRAHTRYAGVVVVTREPGGFTHVFRWDRTAVDVPVRGTPFGQKLRHGAWKCVMCHILLTHAMWWDMDHYNDCPGFIAPAPRLRLSQAVRSVSYPVVG